MDILTQTYLIKPKLGSVCMNHWLDSGIIPGDKMSTTEPTPLRELQNWKMEALAFTVSV